MSESLTQRSPTMQAWNDLEALLKQRNRLLWSLVMGANVRISHSTHTLTLYITMHNPTQRDRDTLKKALEPYVKTALGPKWKVRTH
jgi:hypothetical protein